MSLYIPGLNLPPNCNYCLCRSDTSRYCNAAHEYTPMIGKPEWCPLIEVPPHGRLGDLDALIAENNLGTDCSKCKRDVRSCQYEMIHSTMDFCEWIDDAPTIIPADKEEP